jgi:hypothetical protein
MKDFNVKMYMKITGGSTSAAVATTAAPAAVVTEQAKGSNMVTQTHIHVYEGEGDGCTELGTTYTGTELMTTTSCQQVVSDSVEKGESTTSFMYMGGPTTVSFKVANTCAEIRGMTVVMEASEAESAKILAGQCGEVESYLGDGKGTKSAFTTKMYMKITTSTVSAALARTAAPEHDHGHGHDDHGHDDHGHDDHGHDDRGHDDHGPAPEPAPAPAIKTFMVDTIHLFDGQVEGCVVLDTTYKGSDLMAGTSCKEVTSESLKDGKRSVGLKYMDLQTSLEFQVYETCDATPEMAIGIEASEVESAKILAGECGEAAMYLSDDKSLSFKMYKKIAPIPTTTPAPAVVALDGAPDQADHDDAPQADVADQAERPNMLMPLLSAVMPVVLLAY